MSDDEKKAASVNYNMWRSFINEADASENQEHDASARAAHWPQEVADEAEKINGTANKFKTNVRATSLNAECGEGHKDGCSSGKQVSNDARRCSCDSTFFIGRCRARRIRTRSHLSSSFQQAIGHSREQPEQDGTSQNLFATVGLKPGNDTFELTDRPFSGFSQSSQFSGFKRTFVNSTCRNGADGIFLSRSAHNVGNFSSLDRHTPCLPSLNQSVPDFMNSTHSPLKPRTMTKSSLTRQPGVAFTERIGFPVAYVTPVGTISLILSTDTVIEITVDRAFRVVCHDKFSAAIGSDGNSACIQHENARMMHHGERTFSNFGPLLGSKEKIAVLGRCGVLFTMPHLSEAFLVSATAVEGTTAIPMRRLCFPSLNCDFSLRLLYLDSQCTDEATASKTGADLETCVEENYLQLDE